MIDMAIVSFMPVSHRNFGTWLYPSVLSFRSNPIQAVPRSLLIRNYSLLFFPPQPRDSPALLFGLLFFFV